MSKSTFRLDNPNLGDDDYLYHLGISANDKKMLAKFQDVKFACMGGKASRMEKFAKEMYLKLGRPSNSILDQKNNPMDITISSGRYSMFKVGRVLIFNHGIGMASLSVVLNEILKLFHYAGCEEDVKIIRIGSTGGLGVDPGTIVVTKKPYNGLLEQQYSMISLGAQQSLPCQTSEGMRRRLLEVSKKFGVPAVEGNTMSTDGFFEDQGRLDGAFCDYDLAQKMGFLHRAHEEFGIRNIEMESTCVAALCNRAKLECAIVCFALLDRLKGDKVSITEEEVNLWQSRSFDVVGEYIKQELEG